MTQPATVYSFPSLGEFLGGQREPSPRNAPVAPHQDQEREAAIRIGYEEGLAQGRAAAEAELAEIRETSRQEAAEAGRIEGLAAAEPPVAAVAEALKQLEASGISTDGLRSKSWDEFVAPDAPHMDFVFTVCDNAANEVCPFWPGQPMTAHWGVADPAAVKGSPEEIERAFRDAFVVLDRRIALFLSLPLATLQQLAIQKEIESIGRS